jgi:hypothetical protein
VIGNIWRGWEHDKILLNSVAVKISIQRAQFLFGKRVLRRIFEPKRDEVTGE